LFYITPNIDLTLNKNKKQLISSEGGGE